MDADKANPQAIEALFLFLAPVHTATASCRNLLEYRRLQERRGRKATAHSITLNRQVDKQPMTHTRAFS